MRTSLVLVCALAALLLATPASAHGYIVRALPEDRAALERAPARLQYWFSESLEPAFSTLALRDRAGQLLATGEVDPDNQLRMSLTVPADLADGAYLVDLRPAFASDGHVVAETRVFFVGQAADAAVSGRSGYELESLEVLWRTLLYASCLLLFGAHVLYSAVLLPSWGKGRHRAGGLPPRLMRRLGHIALAALAVAFGANLLAMLQQTMVFFAADAARVLEQGLWQVVRVGSRFGDVWTLRLLLLAFCALLTALALRWPSRYPEQVGACWSANLWATALLLGSFSVNSHAAGSLRFPWLALLADWLHTLAASAWSGGLVALALLLPLALAPLTDIEKDAALRPVLRRFSWLALRALAVLAASGIFSALNWLQRPADLGDTGWGLALLAKLALVAITLLLALGQRRALRPGRLLGVAALTRLRLEALLLTVTLIPLALLAASAVPQPDFGAPVAAPTATQEVAGHHVELSITPGGPGINSLDLRIPGAQQVLLQLAVPQRDWRSAWLEAASVDDALFVLGTDVIDSEGTWQTLVNFTDGTGQVQRAAFVWDIQREAAVPTTLPTFAQHWLALILLVLACIFALWSPLQRALRWFDRGPASVATALGATLAFGLLIVLGLAQVARNEAAFQDALWPPPELVNMALPDAASLARGRSLYDAHCAWEMAALEELRTRLPRIRDEQLFHITQDGWRALTPCRGDLEAETRWHLVNYIRSLA